MNTDRSNDALVTHIDASLARLPDWNPPADLAGRLSAAATWPLRPSVGSRRAVIYQSLLNSLSRVALVAATACAVVYAVDAALPWQWLAAGPVSLAWTLAGVALLVSLWFTQRVLGGE